MKQYVCSVCLYACVYVCEVLALIDSCDCNGSTFVPLKEEDAYEIVDDDDNSTNSKL
jgi:hypothetical protein